MRTVLAIYTKEDKKWVTDEGEELTTITWHPPHSFKCFYLLDDNDKPIRCVGLGKP
jgi:hypothetical protein